MNPNFFDTTKLGYLDEDFTTFFETNQVKIERIVTRGQPSPKNFYYDQEDGEWVLILEGEAELSFSDKTSITLKKVRVFISHLIKDIVSVPFLTMCSGWLSLSKKNQKALLSLFSKFK